MKPVPTRPLKGNKLGPSILSERRKVYDNARQVPLNPSQNAKAARTETKEKAEDAQQVKELLDGLLHLKQKKYPKNKLLSKKIDLVKYAFSCLETLKQNLPVPYPELFLYVEKALKASIYHPTTNAPFFALLPELEREEETLLRSDREWSQRYKEARGRYKNLVETYESDKSYNRTVQSAFNTVERKNISKTASSELNGEDPQKTVLCPVCEELKGSV